MKAKFELGVIYREDQVYDIAEANSFSYIDCIKDEGRISINSAEDDEPIYILERIKNQPRFFRVVWIGLVPN